MGLSWEPGRSRTGCAPLASLPQPKLWEQLQSDFSACLLPSLPPPTKFQWGSNNLVIHLFMRSFTPLVSKYLLALWYAEHTSTNPVEKKALCLRWWCRGWAQRLKEVRESGRKDQGLAPRESKDKTHRGRMAFPGPHSHNTE